MAEKPSIQFYFHGFILSQMVRMESSLLAIDKNAVSPVYYGLIMLVHMICQFLWGKAHMLVHAAPMVFCFVALCLSSCYVGY